MRPSTHSAICAEIQLEHQKRERRLLARIDELTQERDALLELQQECWKLQAAIETVRSERDRLTDAIAAAQAPAPGDEPPPNIARLMDDLEALAREIEVTHYPDAILLAVNELRRLAGAEHELREDVATLEGALAPAHSAEQQDLCQNCGDMAFPGCNSEFGAESACRFWGPNATHAGVMPRPIGYLPAYELERVMAGHQGTLRSARFGPSALDGDVPVYIKVPAPAVAHEPLTDEQIHSLYDEVARSEPYAGAVTRRKVVRAIERAHGIGTFDVPVQGSQP